MTELGHIRLDIYVRLRYYPLTFAQANMILKEN